MIEYSGRKTGGIGYENSRNPVFGIRLLGGGGFLQRSRLVCVDRNLICDKKSRLNNSGGFVTTIALENLTPRDTADEWCIIKGVHWYIHCRSITCQDIADTDVTIKSGLP